MSRFLPVFLALLFPCLADESRGKTIYMQVCFNCHGPHLDGGIGPALNDGYWRHGSSPEAILAVIDKGVPETEMAPFEAVYPQADREALRDFILAQQEGMREVRRSVYPRAPFKGKRLTPALFDAAGPVPVDALPENVYYLGRNVDGVMRGRSKLYIRQPGEYQFAIRPIGRTAILLDGEEVHYSDDKAPKNTYVNKKLHLAAGVYDLEILHEEKTSHSYRFHGTLRRSEGGVIELTGRSLEGNVPKVVKATPEAQVIRKWIAGLPPRSLLCLLPNQVLVAYNPETNQILSAWHSAEVNQTPSLLDRSAKPSELVGTPIADPLPELGLAETVRFLYYEVAGEAARIVSIIDGQRQSLTIAPKGPQSFTVNTEAL
jgi:hypothetical protein